MKKSNKGFTLVELLAVIVILGLLMAIAIPSVTKYITESRKKTLISTMDSYVTAIATAVNDNEFGVMSNQDIMYYVPVSNIESESCVSLEKGGTDPFGNWKEAYVAVNYDSSNYSYDYYFTFYDDAGYGMELTKIEDISATGNIIGNPSPVNADNITTQKNDRASYVKILTPGSCNTQNASDSQNTLASIIKKQNTIITNQPTLTTSSNNTSDASGLYISTATNNGNPTYYFRGDVTNNYVSFAGLIWKIIRINEDGTVRLILKDKINNTNYSFNDTYNNYDKMYYSNGSNAKTQVDKWYQANITDKGYDKYVSTGKFCEQAKVKYSTVYTSGDATMAIYTAYIPDFKCVEDDGNNKGVLSSKAGLITYDEVIYAGGYYNKPNPQYYLYENNGAIWTMSPSGVYSNNRAYIWLVNDDGKVANRYVNDNTKVLRPVINLTASTLATGTGTSSDPYVIQTN